MKMNMDLHLHLIRFDELGYMRAAAALPDRVNTQDDEYQRCLEDLARKFVLPSFAFLYVGGQMNIIGKVVDPVNSSERRTRYRYIRQGKTQWCDAFPTAEIRATKCRKGELVEYNHGISPREMFEACMRLCCA